MITRKKFLPRVPVVYKGKPLTPMIWRRARKLLKENKAVLVTTKTGEVYLKLKFEPSGEEVPEIVLGIDPGTNFTGYSVVSEGSTLANYQRNTVNKARIQESNSLRVGERRTRRNRLRHRPCRNAWRTGQKISKTAHYIFQVRAQMIKDILKLYPVSQIITEDVKYCHWGDTEGAGRGFSVIEVGKNYFKNILLPKITTVPYIEQSTWNAKSMRLSYFEEDRKSEDKGEKTFWAHCFDAFCLANQEFGTTRNLSTKTLFIEEHTKSRRTRRRRLRDFTRKIGSTSRDYWKSIKKCEWVKVERFHKRRRTRYKPDSQKSNHGPWEYVYNFEWNHVSHPRRGYQKFYGYFDRNKVNMDKNPNSKFYNYYKAYSYGQ